MNVVVGELLPVQQLTVNNYICTHQLQLNLSGNFVLASYESLLDIDMRLRHPAGYCRFADELVWKRSQNKLVVRIHSVLTNTKPSKMTVHGHRSWKINNIHFIIKLHINN